MGWSKARGVHSHLKTLRPWPARSVLLFLQVFIKTRSSDRGHYRTAGKPVGVRVMVQASAQYGGHAVGATAETEVWRDNYIKVVWDETSPAGTYFIVANDKGAQKVIGEFEIPPGGHKGQVFICVHAQ